MDSNNSKQEYNYHKNNNHSNNKVNFYNNENNNKINFNSEKELTNLQNSSNSPKNQYIYNNIYDVKKKFTKININNDIDKMKQKREDRKLRNEERKRQNEDENNNFNKNDGDYEKLIMKKKINFQTKFFQHIQIQNEKIFVIVRKRPIFPKEIALGEIDCISALNPSLFIHEPKMKIDGITKYIEDHEFIFDNVFGDHEKTDQVFQFSVEPTIELLFNRGIVTCFAYGQTGSGKTYTMRGIQNSSINSLFKLIKNYNMYSYNNLNNNKSFNAYVSFYEIYGESLYDLLNSRNKLQVLEDKHQVVQIFGLEEKLVNSPKEMQDLINRGNAERTTHNTHTNETSSRSHAICTILIKENNSEEVFGKLTLVDLAGSERAQETQSNKKERMNEGAKINKSLLALKECIRALDSNKKNSESHVPFRNSKLTLVLRDSFLPKIPDKAKIIMIACVSPCYNSANHTLNTLRYSDRLKEKTKKKNVINKIQSKDKNSKKVISCNNIINTDLLKHDDIEFEDNLLLYNKNNDYDYQDLLVEDKIQDLETAKENINVLNSNVNKVRPAKPSVKSSFKPRTKLVNNIGSNSNNNLILNNQNNSNINSKNNNSKFKNKSIRQESKENEVNVQESFNFERDDNSKKILNDYHKPKKPIKLASSIVINNNKKNFDVNSSISNNQINNKKKSELNKSNENAYIDKIFNSNSNLVNIHMNIIKEDAALLTKEGDLVSNIKGVGEMDYDMEAYIYDLERIISKKIKLYDTLKNKLKSNKNVNNSNNNF